MNRLGLLLTMALLAPLGLQAQVEEEDRDDVEKPSSVNILTLDQVPPAALEAARAEKPDVYFDSAERIIWRDEPVYQINGAKGRDIWRVYVNIPGQVLRVERDTRESVRD